MLAIEPVSSKRATDQQLPYGRALVYRAIIVSDRIQVRCAGLVILVYGDPSRPVPIRPYHKNTCNDQERSGIRPELYQGA